MDEFVGIQELKECQRRQLLLFEQWRSEGAWDKFHKNHYDWWTFPINIRSRFGAKYMIDEESVEILILLSKIRPTVSWARCLLS